MTTQPPAPLPMQIDLQLFRWTEDGPMDNPGWHGRCGVHAAQLEYECSATSLRELIDHLMDQARTWLADQGEPHNYKRIQPREGYHLDDFAVEWTLGGDREAHHPTFRESVAAEGVELPATVLAWSSHK